MNFKNTYKAVAVLAVLLCSLGMSALAATSNLTVGGTVGYPANAANKVFVIERTVDYSVTTGTSGDTYQLINIPSNTFVLSVSYAVETVEDSVCTVDIGDGSAAAGYFDNADVSNAVGSAISRWTIGTTAVAPVTQVVVQTTTVVPVTNVTIQTTTVTPLTNVTIQTGSFTLGTNVSQQALAHSGTNWLTNVVIQTGSFTLGTNVALQTASLTYATNVLVQSTTITYATNVSTTTFTMYPTSVATLAYNAGKIYTSTDTIDLLLNNDADTLKITVRAICVPTAGLEGL